jgi:hypothetical protein
LRKLPRGVPEQGSTALPSVGTSKDRARRFDCGVRRDQPGFPKGTRSLQRAEASIRAVVSIGHSPPARDVSQGCTPPAVSEMLVEQVAHPLREGMSARGASPAATGVRCTGLFGMRERADGGRL